MARVAKNLLLWLQMFQLDLHFSQLFLASNAIKCTVWQANTLTHKHTCTQTHTCVYLYTHRRADVPVYTHFVTLRTQIEHKFWLFFPFGKHNRKKIQKKIQVEILDTVKNKVPNATKTKTMTENNENKEERQAVNATEATSDKRHTTNDKRRTVNGAGTTTNTLCMFHILPIRFQQLSLSACRRCHTRRERQKESEQRARGSLPLQERARVSNAHESEREAAHTACGGKQCCSCCCCVLKCVSSKKEYQQQQQQ